MNTWLYCATLFETVRTNMMVNDDLAVACIFFGSTGTILCRAFLQRNTLWECHVLLSLCSRSVGLPCMNVNDEKNATRGCHVLDGCRVSRLLAPPEATRKPSNGLPELLNCSTPNQPQSTGTDFEMDCLLSLRAYANSTHSTIRCRMDDMVLYHAFVSAGRDEKQFFF